MPKGYPRRFEASLATSCPTRVTLNAVFFDRLAQRFKIAAADILQRRLDGAGSGDADIQNNIALGHPMKGAGHKRIIIRSIAEDNQLRIAV